MTYQSYTPNPVRNGLRLIIGSPVVRTVSLLGLCAAYIQGPLTKIFD
ncbi:MAG: DoxX family protein, partial [Oxalobacteraceae bacterium]